MIEIQNTNKDLLAKLMATEDINVLHKNVPTAYFDVKNRTLVCPILKEDMSPQLYDLFMGHEVGHALNTPADGWHGAVSDKGMVFKGYLNVIEDCRIEKMIKAKYPGLRRSFYAGYRELANQDFFGIRGKNLNELNLIDRINLFFKIGSTTMIEFNEEETPYIKRCENLNTFEEVMELALELFDRQQQLTEEELESLTQQELQDLLDQIEEQEGPEDDDQQSGDSFTVEIEEEESESDSDGSDAKGESDEDSEENSDGEESESDEQTSNEETDEKSDEEGGQSSSEKLQDEMNKSNTDESFRENEDQLVQKTEFYDEPSYYVVEDKIKYKNYIVDYKEIDKQISEPDFQGDELDRDPVKAYTKKFQDDNKKIIGYMVKEFEMKKAAAAYNRSWSSKSGELDMNKLHLFKLKDDIFNRVEIIPEGKNHGVVMLLDWSGSMHGTVQSTVEQASLLSMFCRRLQIPFRLFAFSDGYSRSYNRVYEACDKFEYDSKEYKEARKKVETELREEQETKMYGKKAETTERQWSIGDVALLEIFNDTMTNSEFNRSMENWLQLAMSIESRYDYYGDESVNHDGRWSAPSNLNLSGTPLDHSLVIMRDFIRDFKVDYNLDICSLITLTDGASHCVFGSGRNRNLVDKKFNKTFSVDKTHDRVTHGLLEWVKETTGVRTIGFYLKEGRGADIVWDAQKFCGTKENLYGETATKHQKEFNKLSTSFTDGSYDLAILINSKKLKINYQEDELNVDEGATKAQLKRALVKSGNNKMLQRVILNQFVGQMAV